MKNTGNKKQEELPGFEIYKTSKGNYRFVLWGKSNWSLLHSENYKSLQSCKKGIKSVKINAKDLSCFHLKQSKDYMSYCVLKAKNNEIIGISNLYPDLDNNDFQKEILKYIDIPIKRVNG